jgi:hypothetical protein
MSLVIVMIIVSWCWAFIHVLITPKFQFQLIHKSKGLWLFLTIIGCIPACWYYLTSVRVKLKSVEDKDPPLKELF